MRFRLTLVYPRLHSLADTEVMADQAGGFCNVRVPRTTARYLKRLGWELFNAAKSEPALQGRPFRNPDLSYLLSLIAHADVEAFRLVSMGEAVPGLPERPPLSDHEMKIPAVREVSRG